MFVKRGRLLEKTNFGISFFASFLNQDKMEDVIIVPSRGNSTLPPSLDDRVCTLERFCVYRWFHDQIVPAA
jgi:hypothetical protein